MYSLMLESPTITCRRRNLAGSAWGSSRVLIMGLDLVVADDRPSHMCPALWLRQNDVPLGVLSTLPAPA